MRDHCYETTLIRFSKASAHISLVPCSSRDSEISEGLCMFKDEERSIDELLVAAHALNLSIPESLKVVESSSSGKLDSADVDRTSTVKSASGVLRFKRRYWRMRRKLIKKRQTIRARLNRKAGVTSAADITRVSPRTIVAAGRAALKGPEKRSKRSLANLQESVKRNPNVSDLIDLATALWFEGGSLDRALSVLEHPLLVKGDLADEDARSRARLIAIDRIRRDGIKIPHPPDGPAYVPEPNRVMYCVHATPIFNSNGFSTRTLGLASAIASSSVDIRVVSRVGYPWDSTTDVDKPKAERTVTKLDGIEYVHRPGGSIRDLPIDAYFQVAADAYVREALMCRPSVMMAASNHMTALPALIAARRLGIPFIYEVRGLWEVSEATGRTNWNETQKYEFAVTLEKLVAENADQVFAITHQVRDELISRGINGDKIEILANAVDTDNFVPLPKDQEYASRLALDSSIPTIGYAGSLVSYEGLSDLIRASQLLDHRGVRHQLVIAGTGKSLNELKGLTERLNLNTVKFVGRLPHEDMPRLLSLYDVTPFTRRSVPVTELVSPLKPLEAFAGGKACVFSDVSPHRDISGEGQRGLIYPAGDIEGLADCLEKLITDSDLRAELGRRARLWTIDERNWETVAGVVRSAIVRLSDTLFESRSKLPRKSKLKVGVIADEFTSRTIAHFFNTEAIDRNNFSQQLIDGGFDLLFVESAWSGNDGAWDKGIGVYSEVQSADFRALVRQARNQGIPIAFWNKEDPIHFERFKDAAKLCDFVFSTDANTIVKYLGLPNSDIKAVASMPFYAEPIIHNPLWLKPGKQYPVVYAGTFYGERYRERSTVLARLLDQAVEFGLVIFDRQAAIPNSRYVFPERFQPFVSGALPYHEILETYSSAATQLNVNSVTDSPTMFSRRVVEVAASGGVILSGPGRGIREALGSTIPSFDDSEVNSLLLKLWHSNSEERSREAWRQMRTIYRSHTAATELTILARTAGLCIDGPRFATYGVQVESDDLSVVEALASQSIPPVFVAVQPCSVDSVKSRLPSRIKVISSEDSFPFSDYVGTVNQPMPRTFFEDLLLCTHFSDPDVIAYSYRTEDDSNMALFEALTFDQLTDGRFSIGLQSTSVGRKTSIMGANLARERRLPEVLSMGDRNIAISDAISNLKHKVVLFAGHDFKFIQPFMDYLKSKGVQVLIDNWVGHNQHDEENSRELLNRADVVFCEWGLGNAVWYSHHCRENQRLIVRSHSQEIRLPYLRDISTGNVDSFIFVGELILESAVASHGIPQEKCTVIRNYVDVAQLARPKNEHETLNIGMVGVVPRTKRLDLALDVVERILDNGIPARLLIKGKTYSDYPWLMNRQDELAYFIKQDDRIEKINSRWPGAVVKQPFGDDMAEWYQNVDVVLSVSDFESFHLTLPDGVASGAVPFSLNWPGADLIYPREWLYAAVDDIASTIMARTRTVTAEDRRFVSKNFDKAKVFTDLTNVLVEWN